MKKLVSTSIALSVYVMFFAMMGVTTAQESSILTVSEAANLTAQASEVGMIKVVSVEAKQGTDVDVAVEISDNPGIVAMGFSISYDSDVLELVKVEDSKLFNDESVSDKECSFTAGKDIKAIPYMVCWENGEAESVYTNNGTLAVLHFHVLDSAPDGYSSIELILDDENIFDVDLNNIKFESVSGYVAIPSFSTTATSTETTTTTATTTTATSTTTTSATTTNTTSTSTTETTTSTSNTSAATESTASVSTTTATTTSTTTATTTTTTTTTPETTTTTSETVDSTTTEVTTENSTEESTTVTSVSETPTTPVVPSETQKYFAPEEELCKMAITDYQKKTGFTPSKADAVKNEDGTLTITLTNTEGATMDTYVIDPVTGIGKTSDGKEVNLPKTGNNSLNTVAVTASAIAIAGLGGFVVWKSGIIHKHKKDE